MTGEEQAEATEALKRGEHHSLLSLEECLLNNYQKNFPLLSRPFDEIARELNSNTGEILQTLAKLQQEGAISRIGPVLRPNSFNTSMLAAMQAPGDQLFEIAEIVNSYEEVNHNYEREHQFNLWFVVHGRDEIHVHHVLDDIEKRTGLQVIRLPILDAYHIDLGFDMTCHP